MNHHFQLSHVSQIGSNRGYAEYAGISPIQQYRGYSIGESNPMTSTD